MSRRSNDPAQASFTDGGLSVQKRVTGGGVECFGERFPNEAARREYFLQRLAEKLREPAFRELPGFPDASDEAILARSDPPFYTACPNPFFADFVRHYGKQYDPTVPNDREPLAVDTSEGKTDPLYTAHSYHTKVPHKAIAPAILHYTSPGEIVLDGFAGSGMTGVAAQYCGAPDVEFKTQIEEMFRQQGAPSPRWGARRAILNDLSPAATFIEANYNLPVDIEEFAAEARAILDAVGDEFGWMYATLHSDGTTMGRVNYTVWSEVFACPECAADVLTPDAPAAEAGTPSDEFHCPNCNAVVSKRSMERQLETAMDPLLGVPYERPRRRPVLINYSIGKKKFDKTPDAADIELLKRVDALPWSGVPSDEIPYMHMTHERARMSNHGITRVHHFYLPRVALTLSSLWARANGVSERRTRNMLVFFFEQALWTCSVLNRYRPDAYSQSNQHMAGVYYVPSRTAEISPWYVLEGKLERLKKTFSAHQALPSNAIIGTGDCSRLGLPDASVDYVFTDPPFGENIYYADLNFLVESWHRVWTSAGPEAIVDRAREKTLVDYQELMRRCFAEYHRVLKPGRWMTVVFHNSKNSVWNAIQEAMLSAGFVVADVRTLDKQQGSYRQVTSTTVKQDLIISAYKANGGLEQRFRIKSGSEEGVWDFVRTHLKQLPTFVRKGDNAEVVAERTPHRLFDRMVAFHVQRGVSVPLSLTEFQSGLRQRFVERDGMIFLQDQLSAYEAKRTNIRQLLQLQLVITDEASAIKWLRQEIEKKPQTFQELQPKYMKETQGWSKHEKPVELAEILEQNFLMYDGREEIPAPIWAWMQKSSILRERIATTLPSTASQEMKAEGKNRWYVPDLAKATDLEKLREKALLREFDAILAETKRIKELRSEACRAGFKKLWDEGNYAAILDVAKKLPSSVVEEDPWLLMYTDLAKSRAEG